jgi:hypothetical protein
MPIGQCARDHASARRTATSPSNPLRQHRRPGKRKTLSRLVLAVLAAVTLLPPSRAAVLAQICDASTGLWIQAGIGPVPIEARPPDSRVTTEERWRALELTAGYRLRAPVDLAVHWGHAEPGRDSSEPSVSTLKLHGRFEFSQTSSIGVGVELEGGRFRFDPSYIGEYSGRPTASGPVGTAGMGLRVQPGGWLAVHGSILYQVSGLEFDAEEFRPTAAPTLDGWLGQIGIRLYPRKPSKTSKKAASMSFPTLEALP